MVKVDLAEVIDMMSETNMELYGLVDMTDGTLVWSSYLDEQGIDPDEEGDYVPLPSTFDIDEIEIMERFARDQTLSAYATLAEAFHGKGLRRRFAQALAKTHLEGQWAAFEADAYRRLAIVWCRENDLTY